MKTESIQVGKLSAKRADSDGLLELQRQLLEYRAREKDHELNVQLLKELILKYSQAERSLTELNKSLIEKQGRLIQDLEAAAGIQKTLLPKNLSDIEHLEVSWKFLPCELIGGDIFNIFPLDEENVGLYIIDVSGHGVPSALVAVSISQALQPHGGYVIKARKDAASSREIASPVEVLRFLDAEFPLERFDMFFTMIYVVINTREGYFLYGRAGHPPAVLLHRDGTLEALERGGPVVGCSWLGPFQEERKGLVRGDKLILYSDGITEYQNPSGEFYGTGRLHSFLRGLAAKPVGVILDGLMASLLDFGDYAMPQDDISLLGVEFQD
jgi:phosphoserine phosphatase RsbU/P